MRTAQQRRLSGNDITGSRTPVASQSKVRPGAGNHYRQINDPYERQADEVATRVLRGEKRIVRSVSPRAPAGYSLPSSSGKPLPATLQMELEESMGADFSDVRIHTNTIAGEAAMQEGASAFASGRDIFFGPGKYRPASVEGRFLLAHELTHVLQQTGRRSTGGRLKATPLQACGMPQHTDLPDFAKLRKMHAPGSSSSSRSKFDSVAAELEKITSAADPAAGLEVYFKDAISQVKDWPEQAESLLYDTLKRHQKYELASQLIERDDFKGGVRIRTAAWTGGFLTVLQERNKGDNVYPIAVEKHPVLASYVQEWLRLIEVFIFKPISDPIPQLLRYGVKEGDKDPQTISDHTKELSDRLDDNTRLSSNEWVYRALFKLNQLDALRHSKCVDIHNAAVTNSSKTNERTIFLKRRFAEGVRDWGDKFLESTTDIFEDSSGGTDTDLKAAWEPFFKKLGARVKKIGTDALAVWDKKSAVDEMFRIFYDPDYEKGDVTKREAALKGMKFVKQAGEKSGLPAELSRTLKEINRPGTGKESPPPVVEYQGRAEALATRLTEFSKTNLEQPQPKLFHENKVDEEVAYIWLTIWLSEIISNLWWMAGENLAVANVELVDQRIIQRLRLARNIRWLAKGLEWSDVVEQANIITSARIQKELLLGMLLFRDGKFWHPDEKSTIEDLGKLRVISSWEPLTGTHLALLYRKAYYEALADKIKDLSPKSDIEEKRLVDSGHIPFVAGRADKEVRALPHPERWTVKSYEFA